MRRLTEGARLGSTSGQSRGAIGRLRLSGRVLLVTLVQARLQVEQDEAHLAPVPLRRAEDVAREARDGATVQEALEACGAPGVGAEGVARGRRVQSRRGPWVVLG